jgi:hypothetical protein
MGWLWDRSLRVKLLGTCGLIVLLLGACSGWLLVQSWQAGTRYEALIYGEAQGATLAQQMRAQLLLQHQELKNTLMRGTDPKLFETHTGRFQGHTEGMRKLRPQFDQIADSLTDAERGLLERFDAGWGLYVDSWPKALVAYGGPGGGNVKDADAVMFQKD